MPNPLLDEKTLVSIPRDGGRAELRVVRVTAKTSEGAPLAYWTLGEYECHGGDWRPNSPRAVIRPSELGVVTIALMRQCASSIPSELHGAARALVGALEGAKP
jgi:hypothetical protein